MFIQIHQIKTLVTYFFVILILPLCWLPLFLYKSFVILLVRLMRPDFGKTFNPVDTIVEEAGIRKKGYVPKSSIVNSLTLEEPISLQELRDLFQRNVLERQIATSNGKFGIDSNGNNNNTETRLRYPELKQFSVSFMGYTFWKKDEHFQIENHIAERFYHNGKLPSLASLHQDMINKPFVPLRTPWEITLINNYKDDNNNEVEDGGSSTFIIARFHHSMADARSILKLFVECLGEKPLKTAKPQSVSSFNGIMDMAKVPLNYAVIVTYLLKSTIKYWAHPWKCKRSARNMLESRPQLVRMSTKLALKDVKEIGKESGGTVASVIIAIISGAINRVRPDLGKIFSVYILPKDNHPATLVNHAGFGALVLPSDEALPLQRLQKSHQVFRELKASKMGEYLECPLSSMTSVFDPLRAEITWEIMSAVCMGITNIAGEGDGFSIGGRRCSEFIFSVGTLLGDTGVVFCVSSYKEHFRIAVISQDGILTEGEASHIANAMGEELEMLRELCL